MGSLNLIQSAVNHGWMDIVFSSTCATYGDQDNVVLDENSIPKMPMVGLSRQLKITWLTLVRPIDYIRLPSGFSM